MEHIRALVESVEAVDPALAGKLKEKVLSKFADPTMYDSTFPVRAKPRRAPVEDAEDSEQLALEDGDADGSGDVGGSEYMEKLEEELPKAGPLLAETSKSVLTTHTTRSSWHLQQRRMTQCCSRRWRLAQTNLACSGQTLMSCSKP